MMMTLALFAFIFVAKLTFRTSSFSFLTNAVIINAYKKNKLMKYTCIAREQTVGIINTFFTLFIYAIWVISTLAI